MVETEDPAIRFGTGIVVATPGGLEALYESGENPKDYLDRHVRGDWGEVCDEDKQANDQAIDDETRILSAYSLKNGTKIWIITEADRSSTTILLPEEY